MGHQVEAAPPVRPVHEVALVDGWRLVDGPAEIGQKSVAEELAAHAVGGRGDLDRSRLSGLGSSCRPAAPESADHEAWSALVIQCHGKVRLTQPEAP